MKKASSIIIATRTLFVCILLSAGSAKAALCIPGVGCLGAGGLHSTITTFDIYLHNKSRHWITACVKYWSRRSENSSTLSSLSAGGSDTLWENECWDLRPGEKAFVINNARGRYAYFSAKSQNGKLRWDKKRADMGSRYTVFTYGFN